MQQAWHKVMQLRKLCIAVERFTLGGYILIAPINQSRFCHTSRSSTETQAVWVRDKMCLESRSSVADALSSGMKNVLNQQGCDVIYFTYIYFLGYLARLVALVVLLARQLTQQLWKMTTSAFPDGLAFALSTFRLCSTMSKVELIIKRKPLHFFLSCFFQTWAKLPCMGHLPC